MSKKNGFSIFEISLVLLVVSLLAAISFAASQMVENSKIRQSIKDIQNYQSAIDSFRVKYKYKPGDFPEAIEVLGANANGNGSGYVTADTLEPVYVFEHVALAGFLSSDFVGKSVTSIQVEDPLDSANKIDAKLKGGYNVPHAPFGESVYSYMQTRDAEGFIRSPDGEAIIFGSIGFVFNTDSALTALQASEIDKKKDDGKPSTGEVFVLPGFVVQPGYPGVTGSKCTTATTYDDVDTEYYFTEEAEVPNCTLFYGNGIKEWFGDTSY